MLPKEVNKMQKMLKMSYLIGSFTLAMITAFSIVYAQNPCPTPGMPSNPSPSDGATNISINPMLSWSACSNTESYNVYFGTSFNPPYLGNTANLNYALNNLASNTTYFWRIVAMNNCDNFTNGPVWSFKTGCQSPGAPFNPSPKDDGIVVGDATILNWNSSYSDSFDVYFGTSSNPPFLGNTTNASYNIDNLPPHTNFFWKVVAKNNCGYSVPGAVWSFATAPTNPYSASNWTNVDPPYVSSNWSLYGVHFTSSNEGWAVGEDSANSKGVLLHYLSGVWASVNLPDFSPSWELSGVYFTSPEEGWVVGTEHIEPINRGVLLHYLNGSWTNVTPPSLGSNWGLNSVHFTSSNEGWAVGENAETQKGVLLHYSEGTWIAINPPDYPYSWFLNSVYFTSPDDGWAAGVSSGGCGGCMAQYLFLHYLNGSWSSPYILGGGYPVHLNSVYFISPDEGWAVGASSGADTCGTGELFHYSNGSWESSEMGGPCGTLNGVYFTSPNEGWAVGWNPHSYPPEVLFQYWYGHWENISPPNVSSPLNSVYFTSSDEGWAVGGGVLVRFSGEIISTPTTLDGPTGGLLGKSYSYSTGGSTSSLGNPVEYQFDWKGDGSDVSPWGSATQSKTWSIAGIYSVRARARSATNVSVMSAWSNPLSVSISVPEILVTTTTYDFGNVKVKRSKTISFKVTNSGTVNLLMSASLTRTDASMFKITSGSGNKIIKPGKSLSIRVAFKPTSTGAKTSTLEITSNDPITPTVDIPLSGTGQ